MKPQVNLLADHQNRGLFSGARFIQWMTTGLMVILVLTIVQGSWVNWHRAQLNTKLERVNQLNVLLQQTESEFPALVLERELNDELQQLRISKANNEQLLKLLGNQNNLNTQGFYDHLKALADNHRNGLWLTNIHFDRNSDQVQLIGIALDAALIPKYIDDLKQTSFTGTQFEALNIFSLPNKKAWRFIIGSRANEEALEP